MQRIAWILTGMLLLSAPAQAATERYLLDPSHANIFWKSSHFGFSHPSGKFAKAEAELVLDDVAPEKSALKVKVDTKSLVTGIPAFDEHLSGADFFDVARYPTMEFVSTQVERTGYKTAKVTGDLTLHGQTHPLVLDVTLNKKAVNDFNGKRTAGFTATGTLDRTQWGMSTATPGIPAAVELTIDAEMILDADFNVAAPAKAH